MHTTTSATIRISLGDRSYCVEIGAGLLGSLGGRVLAAAGAQYPALRAGPPRHTGGTPVPLADSHTGETPVSLSDPHTGGTPVLRGAAGRAFLVVDDNLPAETIGVAAASLESVGFAVSVERLVATETNKSVAAAERLLVALDLSGHERRDPVVALGGGIVGDIAGFAAAVYRRGVPVIQCPTTLLAMVDASVGGKTGVNLAVAGSLRKNMVGSFWQPRIVVADVASLRSLGDRQFRAGLAECLKHGMIAGEIDPALADWTAASLPRLHCRDEAAIAELVERNVRIKAAIVAGDEREESTGAGGRASLNLGHTFAHAIETIPHLSPDDDPANAPLLHGEAVALGLVAASACSETLGMAGAGFTDRVRRLVADAGLPVAVADLPGDDALLAAMLHDKKVAGGRLRLVLPIGPGRAEVVDDPPVAAVRAGLDAIRRER